MSALRRITSIAYKKDRSRGPKPEQLLFGGQNAATVRLDLRESVATHEAMLLEDHRRRVTRLLRGERHVTDLDRLFADLRMLKPSCSSVQEIGHFAAHRDERDNGISLSRANDIQTSARLWQQQFDGRTPSIDDLREAARANFNIMPEPRIRERLGISKQTAQQSFNKAIKKLGVGRPLKVREHEVLKVFGLSMMWEFALDDRTLCNEFADLLVMEGALAESARVEFEGTYRFISLYALSIMHGARLRMADGETTQLRLASSDSGMLRIKAQIPVADTPKPVTTSVPLFETALSAATHCEPQLLILFEEAVPVEISGDRLVALI